MGAHEGDILVHGTSLPPPDNFCLFVWAPGTAWRITPAIFIFLTYYASLLVWNLRDLRVTLLLRRLKSLKPTRDPLVHPSSRNP